jgi:nuclear transcription Y subunit beta
MSSTPEQMHGAMTQHVKEDAAVPVHSPDDDHPMDRTEEAQAQGLGYEFEVKEQDRWLPIANGAYTLPCPSRRFDLRPVSPICTSTD